MIDLCLRADTEQQLIEALPFLRAEEGWLVSPKFALALYGPLVVTPAVLDGETVITPAVIDDRFHANLRCAPDIAEQVPPEIIIQPTNPSRVWTA